MGYSMLSQRGSDRILCDIPALILASGGDYQVRLRDVSHRGARIRVSVEDLGVSGQRGLADVASAISTTFGSRLDARLGGGDTHGDAVSRELILVRMSIPNDAPGFIDLGCAFSDALSQAEAGRIGVALPAATDPEAPRRPLEWSKLPRAHDVAEGVKDVSRPDHERTINIEDDADVANKGKRLIVARPRQSFAGTITHRRDQVGPRLECVTDTLTPHAILVRVTDGLRRLDVEEGEGALMRAAYEFAETYGEVVQFTARSQVRELWSGLMRVCGVEYGGKGDDLLLTMAFVRPLENKDLKSLGLAS